MLQCAVFLHRETHVCARYLRTHGRRSEDRSSGGTIVSNEAGFPPAGSAAVGLQRSDVALVKAAMSSMACWASSTCPAICKKPWIMPL